MTLILSGTDGLSDVDGSAATPAIRGTDANTGIFFPAADTIAFSEGGVESMRITPDGNVGIGVTPSATWSSSARAIQLAGFNSIFGYTSNVFRLANNAIFTASNETYGASSIGATYYQQYNGIHSWYNAASGTAGNTISFTTAMTLDASGNLLVGATSAIGSGSTIVNLGVARQVLTLKSDAAGSYTQGLWNAATTGDNLFIYFGTETSLTVRGSISYNRAGGLVAYNTTSDYRAKDISGPVTGSGALIDSTPVYMGKMKGATQERPMFIAHETPAYAHTGEKDAVDKDGNPVYQQMDASALIPVMWAEIQSLRKRLATLESA